MAETRKLITRVSDLPTDSGFEVWEESDGSITIWAGKEQSLTVSRDSLGAVVSMSPPSVLTYLASVLSGNLPGLSGGLKLLGFTTSSDGENRILAGDTDITDKIGKAGAPAGYAYLHDAELIELAAFDPQVVVSTLNDGYIYGQIYGMQYRSADAGRTWQSIGALVTTDTVRGFHPCGDGEALIHCANSLRKTVGWGTGSVTVRTVLTTPTTAQFQWWGVDVDATTGKAIATHYDGSDYTASRYVWLSLDRCETFNVIVDQNLRPGGIDRHIHAAVIDRFANGRIYYNDHDVPGTGRTMQYSDDNGATWTSIGISYTREDGVVDTAQPTVMVPTPYGIVMGDDDGWAGTFILPRDGKNKLRRFVKGPDLPGVINGPKAFAMYGAYDLKKQVAYMVWVQQVATGRPYVMAFDGRSGSVIWQESAPLDMGLPGVAGLPGFNCFAFTDTEIVIGSRRKSVADPTKQANWHLRSKLTYAGQNYNPATLPAPRGAKYNMTSPAIWTDAEATGADSMAAGYKALASGLNALAHGNSSTASGTRAHAAGNSAQATAIDSFASGCGAQATQASAYASGSGALATHTEATVVGKGSNSNGAQGVGFGTLSKPGINGVALGYNTSTGTRGVALGWGSKTTDGTADGIAIGYGLTASSWAIVMCNGATATDGGIAIGRTATARDGVAIGYQAATVGTVSKCVMIGRTATVAANNGTAVGDTATVAAGHTDAVALGQGSTTQRSASVAVGPRDIESTGNGKGLILRSPNGTAYRITVSDAGAVSATAI